MTARPILVASLVAAAWFTVVVWYVLNGLGPHGYIHNEVEAWWVAAGWLSSGGIVLGWILWRHWFHKVLHRKRQVTGIAAYGEPSDDNGFSDEAAEPADNNGECGLRMGVAGFGYYSGSVRTDDM